MCNKSIQRGEIYFADLDHGLGSEQDGKRPVLILQNDVGNLYSPTTIVAPLTSKMKKKIPTHVVIKNNNLRYTSIALLEQIRVIDKTRLNTFICRATDDEMKRVDDAICVSLATCNRD